MLKVITFAYFDGFDHSMTATHFVLNELDLVKEESDKYESSTEQQEST